MKRLLTLLALAPATASSFGATLNPIQLLNPAGSTAGQAIVSTGPSTAPAWAPVTASGLSPVAANSVIANFTASTAAPVAFTMPTCSSAGKALQYSGSGIVCTSNYALTTGTLAQFAATTSAQLAGVVSDETGSGSLVFGTSPTLTTATISTPAIANGTMSGTTITNSPISGNSGSFTNLGATGSLSGAAFTNYFASPPAIGGTAPSAGSFTTLSATGLISPASTVGIKGTSTNDSAQAGSVGEYANQSTSTTSMTTVTAAACSSLSLTAGDWDVSGVVTFTPAGTTTVTNIAAGINTTIAATSGPNGQFQNLVFPASATGQVQLLASPVVRESLSATTTIYLVGYASFGTSTMTCNGFIRARRVR